MVEDRTGSIVGDRRSMSLSANSHKHGGELQADDVSLLSQKARAVARENRERRPPQKRERWSDSDTAALINAIPLHMCAWSQMEEASLFESVRTQQQIRDKARNIKVDFLKTNDPLPAGFDCIALGKKEIDSIKALGLNPSRKEDDIDDNGRVINNVWDPEFEVEESRRHRSEEEN